MIEEQNTTAYCALRLNELEHEHYELEDQIKDIDRQIREVGWRAPERVKLLVAERTEKARRLELINVEAETLRSDRGNRER